MTVQAPRAIDKRLADFYSSSSSKASNSNSAGNHGVNLNLNLNNAQNGANHGDSNNNKQHSVNSTLLKPSQRNSYCSNLNDMDNILNEIDKDFTGHSSSNPNSNNANNNVSSSNQVPLSPRHSEAINLNINVYSPQASGQPPSNFGLQSQHQHQHQQQQSMQNAAARFLQNQTQTQLQTSQQYQQALLGNNNVLNTGSNQLQNIQDVVDNRNLNNYNNNINSATHQHNSKQSTISSNLLSVPMHGSNTNVNITSAISPLQAQQQQAQPQVQQQQAQQQQAQSQAQAQQRNSTGSQSINLNIVPSPTDTLYSSATVLNNEIQSQQQAAGERERIMSRIDDSSSSLEARSLRLELESLGRKNRVLRRDLNTSRNNERELEQQIAQLQDKIRSLEVDNLVNLNKMLSPRQHDPSLRMWRTKQQENEQLKNKILTLEGVIDELRGKLRLEETTRLNCEQRLVIVENEKMPVEMREKRLSEEVKTLQLVLSETTHERNNSAVQLEEAEKQVARLQAQVDQLEISMKEDEKRNSQDAAEKLDAWVRRSQRIEEEMSKTERYSAEVAQENERIKQNVGKYEMKIEQAEAKAKSMEAEVTRLIELRELERMSFEETLAETVNKLHIKWQLTNPTPYMKQVQNGTSALQRQNDEISTAVRVLYDRNRQLTVGAKKRCKSAEQKRKALVSGHTILPSSQARRTASVQAANKRRYMQQQHQLQLEAIQSEQNQQLQVYLEEEREKSSELMVNNAKQRDWQEKALNKIQSLTEEVENVTNKYQNQIQHNCDLQSRLDTLGNKAVQTVLGMASAVQSPNNLNGSVLFPPRTASSSRGGSAMKQPHSSPHQQQQQQQQNQNQQQQSLSVSD